mgnify:CR=1 FL=1
MNLTIMWMVIAAITALPLANDALAGDEQMSSNLSKELRAVCRAQGSAPRGWRDAKVTPDAKRSLTVILHQMNATGKLKQINNVRTKRVGGIHYAMEFELEDGQVWNAIVLHSSRGDYMIERHAKKGELCPKQDEKT